MEVDLKKLSVGITEARLQELFRKSFFSMPTVHSILTANDVGFPMMANPRLQNTYDILSSMDGMYWVDLPDDYKEEIRTMINLLVSQGSSNPWYPKVEQGEGGTKPRENKGLWQHIKECIFYKGD